MTSAEMALAVFAICNSMRVFAYVPQIVKISRDQQGAAVISYITWALFGVSHLSTVVYAVLVVDDWRMAAIFAANTLCCVLILALTAWKRAVFRAAQKIAAASVAPVNTSEPAESAPRVTLPRPFPLRVIGQQHSSA